MQHLHTPSSSQAPLAAQPAPAGRTFAGATWRLLWALPVFGSLLVMPQSPAKWVSLALLLAAVSVLHADSIVRIFRPQRSTAAASRQQDAASA
jgi:hypothetical protein